MKLNKQGVRDLGSSPAKVPDFGKNQMPPEMASKLLEEGACPGHCGINHPPDHIHMRPRTKFGVGGSPYGGEVADFGPPLSPETNEFLVLLAEECAETIKRSTKVQRFGMRKNPWDGQDNVDRLEAEIGDTLAALDVLTILGVISPERIDKHQKAKLAAFVTEEDPARPRLRHATPELRAKIAAYARLYR